MLLLLHQAGAGGELIEDEEKFTGHVRWSTVVYYFKSASIYLVIPLFFFSATHAVFESIRRFWLSEWTDDEFTAQITTNMGLSDSKRFENVLVYSGLG